MILSLANWLKLLGKKKIFDTILDKHWMFLSMKDQEELKQISPYFRALSNQNVSLWDFSSQSKIWGYVLRVENCFNWQLSFSAVNLKVSGKAMIRRNTLAYKLSVIDTNAYLQKQV